MRDTLVDVYGQNKKMKVNAAGKKEFGGLKNLYKTLAENFNVKVDGYAEVGFKGFEQAVNAVGGVEVELSDRLNTLIEPIMSGKRKIASLRLVNNI